MKRDKSREVISYKHIEMYIYFEKKKCYFILKKDKVKKQKLIDFV
jgi:hypothetical protein